MNEIGACAIDCKNKDERNDISLEELFFLVYTMLKPETSERATAVHSTFRILKILKAEFVLVHL